MRWSPMIRRNERRLCSAETRGRSRVRPPLHLQTEKERRTKEPKNQRTKEPKNQRTTNPPPAPPPKKNKKKQGAMPTRVSLLNTYDSGGYNEREIWFGFGGEGGRKEGAQTHWTHSMSIHRTIYNTYCVPTYVGSDSIFDRSIAYICR